MWRWSFKKGRQCHGVVARMSSAFHHRASDLLRPEHPLDSGQSRKQNHDFQPNSTQEQMSVRLTCLGCLCFPTSGRARPNSSVILTTSMVPKFRKTLHYQGTESCGDICHMIARGLHRVWVCPIVKLEYHAETETQRRKAGNVGKVSGTGVRGSGAMLIYSYIRRVKYIPLPLVSLKSHGSRGVLSTRFDWTNQD